MLVCGGLIALLLGGAFATAMAGDLLRGGYTTGGGGQSSSPGSFTPPSAVAARASMQDSLARATRAIDAVRTMQNTARKLAVSAGRQNLGFNPNNPSEQLPNVPNGLGIGGLQPATGATANSSLWSGALLPTQTTSKGQTTVTVDQKSPDAVLTWNTFNIGSATTLKFDQSKTGASAQDSIAFNIIADPSGVPSQILGSIQAPGQVYVINQNGIIFGGGSQVNVHALVASSLPINDYLIKVGLVNNPDDQFLFSSLAIPALASNPTAPAFTPPPAPNTPDGRDGAVTVQAGAVLESPAGSSNTGGKIALVGPVVSNEGTILTPDGQTILAAGEQVAFLPHPTTDPGLRGLDVYIGQGGGAATNTGDIEAPEGDVTMMGASVNQLGAVISTTSVSLNGEINLKADTGSEVVQVPEAGNKFETTEAGSVTFGPASITEILPEVDSSATITSAEPPPNQALALVSQVNVQGETIHLAGNAELLAPNATVTMQAGNWLPTNLGEYGFEYTKGQIYLDSGASINVAGSEDVSAPVTQNNIAVQLLGPELADSPLQRNSFLEGQTIYVDIRDSGIYDGEPWIGTPLADAFGYADLVEYTVGELTTNGGTVTMQAGGSVVMQKGAEVNVSGGWIDYSGGIVTTTDLISGGHIYPINEATPDLVYSGFLPQFNVDEAKWGVSETYDDPLITDQHYEQGYLYGGNGGSVSIIAPSTALQGTLLGLTVNGPRQVGPDAVQAASSALTVAFEGDQAVNPYQVDAPSPPAVVFSEQDNLPAVAPFSVDSQGNPAALSTELTKNVVLSPGLLTSDGFGNLTVRNGDGSVTVPQGVTLDAGDGGSVTMTAANMDIAGSIVAPDGSISLTVYDYSPYVIESQLIATPAANPARGNFILGSGASLDVAGLVIDDRDLSPGADTQPLDTAGGTVSIASYNANLEAGSVIDASGGVELNGAGRPNFGAGGSISILAGNDPIIDSLVGGRLELNAELLGYSGIKGGSLTVQTSRIQIGGEGDDAGVLLLTPSFFDQGGFSSFTLTALGAAGKNGQSLPSFTIAPGTLLDPVEESLIAVPYAPGDGGLQVEPALLAVGTRTPVSLAFNAVGETNLDGETLFGGSFSMGANSLIETDPLGAVSITGQTVSILGSIDVPGGKISLSAADTAAAYGQNPPEALPTLYLSPQTTLSTAGTTVYTPNNRGFITGSVTNGGSITLSGNILAAAGSVLDVSGASAMLDESPVATDISLGLNGEDDSSVAVSLNGSFAGALLQPALIESNGGAITLKGSEEMFINATLIGKPGGSDALGGTLTVSSGIFNPDPQGNPLTPSQTSLIVTENGLEIGSSALGQVVTGPGDQILPQLGHIAVQNFGGGGFGAINLDGSVEFSGPVSITAGQSISVATGGFLSGDAAVSLSAPFVALGTAFQPPLPPDQVSQYPAIPFNSVEYTQPPTYGTGSLTVTAQLIDVGDLSLQGVGSVKLIADGGSIQGDGTLDVAGNIYLRAAQVYPPTETTFTIAAYDYTDGGVSHDGSVTIVGSGVQALPLSAGGTLDIYAANIIQDGVLRAPFGTINLGWDGAGSAAPVDPLAGVAVDATQNITLGKGSVTSVSAIDPISGKGVTIPYGTILNGVSWIDPSGTDITTSGAPQKAINISGGTVTEAAGATIDIRGGGDLFAYEFVPGNKGDADILNTTSGFAVIPGYSANDAPYAPFDPNQPQGSTELANLGGDLGYVNGALVPGDRIYLAASDGLAAGIYTLLPARYAAMPGAFLVTPVGGNAGQAGLQPDGSSVTPGYRIGTGQPVVASFEVEPPAVVEKEAQYDTFSGTTFLGARSAARTPADSGELILQATKDMSLEGAVLSKPLDAESQGGVVEIGSPEDIFIAAEGQSSGAPQGDLVLDAGQLSAIGAQTLLIGGYATAGVNGAAVTVETNDLTVGQNAALSGADIILVANDDLALEEGASVTAEGSSDGMALAVSGNGALLRVSNDEDARIVRSGITSTGQATLSVDAGVTLKGESAILDSSQNSTLDPAAKVDANAVTLDSGLISILEPDASGAAPGGLVLSGNALQQISADATSLTLLSYTAIDIYGTGQIGSITGLENLTLSAPEIAGFDQGGGTATLAARNVTLEGNANGTAPAGSGVTDGTLSFDGGVIELGGNGMKINGFTNVELSGAGGIVANGEGSITVQDGLTVTAPVITGAAGSQQAITAGGAVILNGDAGKATVEGGLAASLSISGASIDDETNIMLPSGTITLHATAGNLEIGDSASTRLSVAGTVKNIFDLTEYTPGGTVNLEGNSVTLGEDGTIDVSAPAAGGNAGTLNISDPDGQFTEQGKLVAESGAGGSAGNFLLDVNTLPALSALNGLLDAAGFTQSVQIEVQTGDLLVDGVTSARSVDLSTDQGSITVTGEINASGQTGGQITLTSAQSVTLEDGADVDVSAQTFDDAGKGGAVTLSAGADIAGVASPNGWVDVEAGSTINLGVAESAKVAALQASGGNPEDSDYAGDFAGTLLIRAPQMQTASGIGVQVDPILGTIDGAANGTGGAAADASSVVVEGYKIYNTASTGGAITSALETQIRNDGIAFLGANGVTTPGYTALMNSLIGANADLSAGGLVTQGLTFNVESGAEVINLAGNLTLGTASSSSSSDWNLASDRFGPDGTAGQLVLRASGNIVFYNSLSDGFTGSQDTASMLAQNPLLPANIQSWSYTLAAGANMNAADPDEVVAGVGSVEVGKNDPQPYASSPGSKALTQTVLGNYYQVIRTGAGNIDVSAGDNVELLNPFATIYTAGTQVMDPALGGSFDTPEPSLGRGSQGALGYSQESPIYPVQYSYAGGNVTIAAQNDIEHLTLQNGQLVEASELETPNNWLDRRGYYVDGASAASAFGEDASTTWWVDFSNFFEGVGALGGGNVTLKAGSDVANVDAVAPTNARMPMGTPSAAALVELGGGDVTVTAGNDINAGIYYVERGQGTLTAGNSIITNSTRAGTQAELLSPATVEDSDTPGAEADAGSDTWLPTTLFLGQGDFTVSAAENILLGPVANAFLMPEGMSNTFWYKTYFSTYGTADAVDVTSLGGSVTLREGATVQGNIETPLLATWLENVELLNAQSVSDYQPWLRLDETDVSDFQTAVSLMPGTLRVAALSGDVNVVGNLTLSPSPEGTLNLVAAGSINGVQPNGLGFYDNDPTATAWNESTINVSDADPNAIPGVTNPFAYQSVVGTSINAETTDENLLQSIDQLFEESGQTNAVLQTKEELHGESPGGGPLHAGNATPVELYAQAGSISGITLYSPEETRVIAGQDVSDIALYIQDDSAAGISVISAGNNIVAYDPNSALRTEAQAPGNFNEAMLANEGDIQISGPGTLEVLAGNNLNMGVGPNGPAPGLGVGITSIGNQRNPYLPQAGADVIAAAGLGPLTDLSGSELGFKTFIDQFVTGPEGAAYLPELPSIATNLPAFSGAGDFDKLTAEEQDIVALDVFFLVLRDSGRAYNTVGSPGYGTYATAYNAISDLFPHVKSAGDITLTSREIASENGGNISILDPAGNLTVGVDVPGNQPLDQGIFTEDGGNISIFTKGDVLVGTSRIFTLRGGNEIIWSTTGDIAAGESPKTVQEAPPTQVIVDPQSANVETDLGGLATGGGIGVLASLQGVPPGNVDLIAPVGTVDAGDAGIRVTGNLNIAAARVLNASNIEVGGASSGVPVTVVVAPNIAGLTAAASSAGAGAAAASSQAAAGHEQPGNDDDAASIVTVQVIGYGGPDL